MNADVLNRLHAYAVKIRRNLHEYPEVGFDLPRTAALIKSELENMGIESTDRYGPCSLAAELGNKGPLIALRADTDALPVEEKTGLPYASKIKGQMHACGHDSHTGVLLAVARYLKEQEENLPCRVRLIFQPSEEGAISGAKMMVENGVMEGVDHILCTHCENALEAGKIGYCAGDYMAACVPLTIVFHGHTAHAALRQGGVDAILMGVKAYEELHVMAEKEAGNLPYIWSTGVLSGGTAHNVIADRCEMQISFRFYDNAFAARVRENTFSICEKIAKEAGGSVEIDWHMSTGPIYNDPKVIARFDAITRVQGMEVTSIPRRMSSEDFAWYLEKAPGMIFRFGTRNETMGCTQLAHRNDFCMDESGMKAAIQAFIAYILEYK
ncbi:MAG: amidohydrolase [Clostridiales bacterium]|nr:amidohydrolase [Clostridiales bacterium]